jgi:hypothetical protein
MKLREFVVIYCPFPTSDATSEQKVFAVDEADAKNEFEKMYSFRSLFRVKEIKAL